MSTKSRFLRVPVEPFTVEPGVAVDDVLARMERVSFQGRKLATARVWEKMLAGDCTIFLGLAGEAGVPIFCPAIADSSIGIGLSQARHRKVSHDQFEARR